ncbi:MAG: type II toxin-antitoxin system VapC family toxin [Bacteroidetes bacterium]|nr:MAG: type II toxin-antitoxin system VapC family toxin [Bacteroidota bacterium]
MIVIDTHIVIWDALKPEMLSKKAKNAIKKANDSDGIIISDISFWEIAMLVSKKRIEINVPYLEFIKLVKSANNIINQGINPEIADISVSFPAEINADPADRIICATSVYKSIPLITADKNLIKSTLVETIW